MATDGPTNATRDDGTRYYRGGCVRGMPRVGACHTRCLHREMVEDYRSTRHAWEEARESGRPVSAEHAGGAAIAMHQLEDDDYAAAYPPPTFRAWLEGHRTSQE